MSIASEITALTTDRNNIRTALVNKGVTAASNHGFDDFASDIASISSGGTYIVTETPDSHGGTVLEITTDGLDLSNDTVTPAVLHAGYTAHDASGEVITGTYVEPYIPVVEKMVNFYDYNGQLVYSYYDTEFAALTEMPSVPSHIGLTSQGWNWTLADAKAEVAVSGVLDIGAQYVTNDGKTRLYVSIWDNTLLSIILNITVNGSAKIDWGDNTQESSFNGASITNRQAVSHTYSSTGSYVISIYPSNPSSYIGFYNSSTESQSLIEVYGGVVNTSYDCFRGARSILQKVEFGPDVFIGQYAFKRCYNLTSVTMSSTLYDENVNGSVFNECQSLSYLTIPSGAVNIGGNFFYNCSALKKVSIPKSCTTIGNYAFAGANTLNTMYFPSSVTLVQSYAFYYNYGIRFVRMTGCAEITSYSFYYCSALRSVILSSNLTSVYSDAFRNCLSLNNVFIPNSVTSIASTAFYECRSLNTINIPTSSTVINSSCYANCYGLIKVTIPASITTINSSAFNSCVSLREIHFLGTTPPTVSSSNVFSQLSTQCKIYVPSGYLGVYTTQST